MEFSIPVGTVGDSWDRYWVRIEEIRQSMRIIEQLIDNIPEGKHTVIKPAIVVKVPEGIHYGQVETAKFETQCARQRLGRGVEVEVDGHVRPPEC